MPQDSDRGVPEHAQTPSLALAPSIRCHCLPLPAPEVQLAASLQAFGASAWLRPSGVGSAGSGAIVSADSCGSGTVERER